MMTLNQNTVKVEETADGTWQYKVLDSLGRRQRTFGSIGAASRYAGSICRYGWALELSGHATGSDCHGEHLAYEAAAELSALSVRYEQVPVKVDGRGYSINVPA